MPSRSKSFVKLQKTIESLVNLVSTLRREISEKIAIIHRLETRIGEQRRDIMNLNIEMAKSSTDIDLENLNRFIDENTQPMNILDLADFDSESAH